MKRVGPFILCCVFLVIVTACSVAGQEKYRIKAKPVEIEVVTSFADSKESENAYREAYQSWEQVSQLVVADKSFGAGRSYEERVVMDFITGSEPDVLFFSTGESAEAFISAGKVVSVEEIHREFPTYGENQEIDKFLGSGADGKSYAMPVNASWEAMFVNKAVLREAGVQVPDADYTWDAFLQDCEKIKHSEFVPIAAALGDAPESWWDYLVLNNMDPELRTQKITAREKALIKEKGLEELQKLHTLGYLPKNTTHLKAEKAMEMFLQGKAAFFVGNSASMEKIIQACQSDKNDSATLDEEMLKNFGIVYFPGTKNRAATEVICKVSAGYYITRKAWESPEKREAAVEFVSHMTSDEVAPKFTENSLSLLVKKPRVDLEDLNSLQTDARRLMRSATICMENQQAIFAQKSEIGIADTIVQMLTGEMGPKEAAK